MNRNESRKLKYNLLKNATGDTKLAQKYRDASVERIEKETGVKIPISKPQSRAEKRKINYRAIKNATGDTKLAQKYRDASLERITKELGIIIPSKKPKLKKFTENEKRKKRLELDNYRYAVESGVPVEEAIEYKTTSLDDLKALIKKRVEKSITGVNYYEPSPDRYDDDDDDDDDDESTNYVINDWLRNLDQTERISYWSEWATKGNDYPEEIKNKAMQINIKMGFDDNAQYGWYIAYNVFTTYGILGLRNDILVNKTIKRHQADRFTEAVIYKMDSILK